MLASFIWADHDEYPATSSSPSEHGHNISILFGFGTVNHFLATRMRFSLGGLHALRLIDADLPRIANRNVSASNVKLTGQVLSLMTRKMGDADRDHADGADSQ